MLKKSVVALALFAGLLTSNASFAQTFAITSAGVASATTGSALNSSIDPNRVTIAVHQDAGRLHYDLCWVLVKYYGGSPSAALLDGQAIVTRMVPVRFQAGQSDATVTADLFWTPFAEQAGLKGRFVFFNAKVMLPSTPSSKVMFNAIAP